MHMKEIIHQGLKMKVVVVADHFQLHNLKKQLNHLVTLSTYW